MNECDCKHCEKKRKTAIMLDIAIELLRKTSKHAKSSPREVLEYIEQVHDDFIAQSQEEENNEV